MDKKNYEIERRGSAGNTATPYGEPESILRSALPQFNDTTNCSRFKRQGIAKHDKEKTK